jgi:required for meiotic nuclear division protein 1
MLKILSSQIADSIDIKLFKSACKQPLLHSGSDELFYEIGPDKYVFVFRYGVVAFCNHEEQEVKLTVRIFSIMN